MISKDNKYEYKKYIDIKTEDMFAYNQGYYPSILSQDLNPNDPWVMTPKNYPMYYNLFRDLYNDNKSFKFLEIGMRTGNMSVVVAKSMNHIPCYYTGVDNNSMLANSSKKAKETLDILRAQYLNFDYNIILGDSTTHDTFKLMEKHGPYDMIHVDGEHIYKTALSDILFSKKLIKPDGHILVDDWDWDNKEVEPAVRKCFEQGLFTYFKYIPTHRGLVIIK